MKRIARWIGGQIQVVLLGVACLFGVLADVLLWVQRRVVSLAERVGVASGYDSLSASMRTPLPMSPTLGRYWFSYN